MTICKTCGEDKHFGLMIPKDDCDHCFCHRLPHPPAYIERRGLLVPNPITHVIHTGAEQPNKRLTRRKQ